MVYMVNMANMVNRVTCAADKMSAPPAPPAAISMVAEARGTHRARATMWGCICRRERWFKDWHKVDGFERLVFSYCVNLPWGYTRTEELEDWRRNVSSLF